MERFRTSKVHNVFLCSIPLFFLTGLRIGELAALKWEHVHDSYLSIEQSLKVSWAMAKEGDEIKGMRINRQQ